ncbi:MAG: hypothetical protein WBV62_11635, partial [Roseobacter sp.]
IDAAKINNNGISYVTIQGRLVLGFGESGHRRTRSQSSLCLQLGPWPISHECPVLVIEVIQNQNFEFPAANGCLTRPTGHQKKQSNDCLEPKVLDAV